MTCWMRWREGWTESLFGERWYPFHPILFFYLLASKVWVVFSGQVPAQLDPGLRGILYWPWLLLGFLCPAMVFLSFWQIYRCNGATRYAGFWLRFGGDFGQLLAMTVFFGLVLFDNDHADRTEHLAWKIDAAVTAGRPPV